MNGLALVHISNNNDKKKMYPLLMPHTIKLTSVYCYKAYIHVY